MRLIIIAFILMFVLASGTASASLFTPQGDMWLRNIYSVYGITNLSMSGTLLVEGINITQRQESDNTTQNNLITSNNITLYAVDGTKFNLTGGRISGNLTVDGYLSGQPINGSIGSGIIYSSSNKLNCGCVNVTNGGGLSVGYPNLIVRIVNIDGNTTYCNLTEGTVTVEDNKHKLYYMDSSCSFLNTTFSAYYDLPINPPDHVRIFDVYTHDGEIEVLKGNALLNLKDTQRTKVVMNFNNLKITNGLDVKKNTFPSINQTSGNYLYINAIVTSQARNTEFDGLHFVYQSGGDWTHSNQTGLNLTDCSDGIDTTLCSDNKYRRYLIYSIGWGVHTRMHELAPLDSETYTTLARCMNIETNPLSFTLPSEEDNVAVIHHAYCGRRDDSAWQDGFIDLRTGVFGYGASIDTSIFMTNAAWLSENTTQTALNLWAKTGTVNYNDTSGVTVSIGTKTGVEKLTVLGNVNVTGFINVTNVFVNGLMRLWGSLFIDNINITGRVISDNVTQKEQIEALETKQGADNTTVTTLITGNNNTFLALSGQKLNLTGGTLSGALIGTFGTFQNGLNVTAGGLIVSAGNVGIGTTTPTELLHLKKAGTVTIKLESTTLGSLIEFNRLTSNNAYTFLFKTNNTQDWAFGNAGTGMDFEIYDFSTDKSVFTVEQGHDSGLNLLRLKGSTSTVGILTNNPSVALDVGGKILTRDGYYLGDGGNLIIDAGDVASDVYIGDSSEAGDYPSLYVKAYNSGGGGIFVYPRSASAVDKYLNMYHEFTDDRSIITGTGDIILQPTGSVGIGTSTPNQKLQVVGNANVSGTVYYGALQANSPHAFLASDKNETQICIEADNGKVVLSYLHFNGLGYEWKFKENAKECLDKKVLTSYNVTYKTTEVMEGNQTVNKSIETSRMPIYKKLYSSGGVV